MVQMSAVTSSMKSSLLTKLKDSLPQSPMMWIVALTCVVLLVTLSRMLALQRSIQDLQAKPSVDESVVRQLVRHQLEETVRSIEQQNKAHMQMHAMRAQEAARRAAQPVEAPVAPAPEAPPVPVAEAPPAAAAPEAAVPVAEAPAVEKPAAEAPAATPAQEINETLDDDVVTEKVEKVDRRRKK